MPHQIDHQTIRKDINFIWQRWHSESNLMWKNTEQQTEKNVCEKLK